MLQHVHTGQPFRISARDYNQIVDVVNGLLASTTNPKMGSQSPSIVRGKNESSDTDIAPYTCVELDALGEFRTGLNVPDIVFTCNKATADTKHYGITQGYLTKNGGMGSVIIAGWTRAMVTVTDLSHTTAKFSDGKLISTPDGHIQLFIPANTVLSQNPVLCVVFLPFAPSAGAEIFFARPWAKNETYSSEGFNVYNADVFETCQADTSPDSNQLMYIPFWVTPYEIDFTVSSPVITACIKSDVTLPVPDDAPAGTKPTTLTVYVPIDNGWVIR